MWPQRWTSGGLPDGGTTAVRRPTDVHPEGTVVAVGPKKEEGVIFHLKGG